MKKVLEDGLPVDSIDHEANPADMYPGSPRKPDDARRRRERRQPLATLTIEDRCALIARGARMNR